MKIIDAHIHPFYDISENYHPYCPDLTGEEFKAGLERVGITGAVGSVLYKKEGTDDFVQIRRLNADAYRLQCMWNGFYSCGLHIHPAFVKESCEELGFYHKKGVRIIGELCPYLMGYEGLLSDGMFEILSFARDRGFTVCVHTTNAAEIKTLCANIRGLKAVFAHPAYGREYEERLQAIRANENAYLDLSGTGIAALGMLEYGVQKIGSEKILFGTDYPIYNPSLYICAVTDARLTAAEKENIFFRNAERIYFHKQ